MEDALCICDRVIDVIWLDEEVRDGLREELDVGSTERLEEGVGVPSLLGLTLCDGVDAADDVCVWVTLCVCVRLCVWVAL